MLEIAQFFGALFFLFGIWCGWQNHTRLNKPKFKVNWRPNDE